MQKPNLSAISKQGVDFLMKVKFTHLHENDILVSEDGYCIRVLKDEDELYSLEFKNALDFAQVAYDIGNRHQPIEIHEHKIKVLNDVSIHDVIQKCKSSSEIQVEEVKGFFKPNGKMHHKH